MKHLVTVASKFYLMLCRSGKYRFLNFIEYGNKLIQDINNNPLAMLELMYRRGNINSMKMNYDNLINVLNKADQKGCAADVDRKVKEFQLKLPQKRRRCSNDLSAPMTG